MLTETFYTLLYYQMVCVHHMKAQEVKTCKFKNKGREYEAKEGEVVQLKKTKLRVCENGKTVLKKKTDFKFPYNFACRGNFFCCKRRWGSEEYIPELYNVLTGQGFQFCLLKGGRVGGFGECYYCQM